MCNHGPNPISEYYIAYFDILGYKSFFEETPDATQEFLNAINDAVHKVKEMLYKVNNSQLVALVTNLEIKIKIFSDNILLCTNVGTEFFDEKIRILTFMYIVSEIQRNFIIQYGLFVRGGFTKGNLSFNDDFVFGKGLIEAVEIEGNTIKPRISISDKINAFLDKVPYSREEAERAINIEESNKRGEDISTEDKEFYNKLLSYARKEYFIRKLGSNIRYECKDDVICISYLFCINLCDFLSDEEIKKLPEWISQFHFDDRGIPSPFLNIDAILKKHKESVEQQLMKHTDYTVFDTADIKKFDFQKHVLGKYVWAMYYHNYMCKAYNKLQYYIYTKANCEDRHMRLTVFVVDENGNFKK